MAVRGGHRIAAYLRVAKVRQLAMPRRVQIGFFSDQQYADGTDLPMVAAVNEFGSAAAGVPERPFMRRANVGLDAVVRPLIRQSARRNFGAVDVLGAKKVGLVVKGRIQKSIRDLDSPPNAPFTIAQKGSSSPLIDEGTMLTSVDVRIE